MADSQDAPQMDNSSPVRGMTPPLRILMVAPQPFFRARGTPFSVLHRIRVLVEAGHLVDLITYPFGENVDMDGLRIIRSGRPRFVHDVKIGPSIAKLMLDVPLYWETVKALRNRDYDILHSHEEAAFFAVRLARTFGLIHIYDMHSSLPHQLSNFSSFNLGPVRSLFSWFERNVLQTCNGVITICKELEEIALPLCGDTPHRMIENTADDQNVFPIPGHDTRAKYALSNRPLILYTGTFESYQGLDLLLRSFQLLRERGVEAQLILVGGRQKQIDDYRKLAADLEIIDDVMFVGTVHPSEIPGFIDAADLIVSPRSAGTNTPLKLYGYMRSGKPLVATDLLTHTQTLDEEIACLVPASSEGIAEGIAKILGNPNYAQKISSAAKSRADLHYSDSGYVNKVLGFYDEVLGQSYDSTDGSNQTPDSATTVEPAVQHSERTSSVK